MGKFRRVLRCYHCGAILQCEKPDEKGYIVPESLNRATPIQIIYCDRCFETMKAFNNSELNQDVDQGVLKILNDAFATDAYIIWVPCRGQFLQSSCGRAANSLVSLGGADRGMGRDAHHGLGHGERQAGPVQMPPRQD